MHVNLLIILGHLIWQVRIDVVHPVRAAWLQAISVERAFYTQQLEHGALERGAYDILEHHISLVAAAVAGKVSELNMIHHVRRPPPPNSYDRTNVSLE